MEGSLAVSVTAVFWYLGVEGWCQEDCLTAESSQEGGYTWYAQCKCILGEENHCGGGMLDLPAENRVGDCGRGSGAELRQEMSRDLTLH